MIIALCQMEVVPKDLKRNFLKIQEMATEAATKGVDAACFSEMCVPGYMVGDQWEDLSFLQECKHYNLKIKELAENLGINILFGSVDTLPKSTGEDGRLEKENAAFLVAKGEMLKAPKVNLPSYREFEDKRYFKGGGFIPYPTYINKEGDLSVTPYTGFLSMSTCEDGWDQDYIHKPIQGLAQQLSKEEEVHIHVNLSCSPFTKGKNAARNRVFSKHSEGFTALCYVNNVGIQNNGKNVFVFDGSTTIYKDGKVLAALPPLEECIGYFGIDLKGEILLEGPWLPIQQDPSLADVLVYGTKKFLEQSRIKKVVIGLSGGIDSALSALIHAKALGPENVVLVNMPTTFNSKTTRGIAKEIATNLKSPYLVIPIERMCDEITSSVREAVFDSGLDLDYTTDAENIAARMRGAGVQAALAAGLKAVFPNNGNKSETAVGYCTMAGDHMGYLAPLADLWKHEVYEVAKQLSDKMGGILPDEIFTLKPSAELSLEHMVDEGKGDPLTYWYHDKLLASWVEPWTREGLLGTLSSYVEGTLLNKLGLAGREQEFAKLFPTDLAFCKDVKRWWNLFHGMAIIKRVQSPPILVVSRRAFGFDYREAIGAFPPSEGVLEILNTLGLEWEAL